MASDIRNLINQKPDKTSYRNDRILRWPQVHERVSICRSHAHQLAAEEPPCFPRPIKLGQRASGWLESEINQWIADRIAESRSVDSEAKWCGYEK